MQNSKLLLAMFILAGTVTACSNNTAAKFVAPQSAPELTQASADKPTTEDQQAADTEAKIAADTAAKATRVKPVLENQGNKPTPEVTTPQEGEQSVTQENQPTEEKFIYKSLGWARTGGGSNTFSLQPASDGSFEIKITRYNFSNVSITQSLKQSDNEKLFKGVQALFMGKVLPSETSEDPNLLSGTWTSLVLIDQDNKITSIKHPQIAETEYQSLLTDLEAYVLAPLAKPESHTPTQGSACEGFDLAGVWGQQDKTVSGFKGTISKISHVATDENGIRSYQGTDEKHQGGYVDKILETKELQYRYDPKSCIIEQNDSVVKSYLLITSVIKNESGLRVIKMTSCSDENCTTLEKDQSGKEVQIEIEELSDSH